MLLVLNFKSWNHLLCLESNIKHNNYLKEILIFKKNLASFIKQKKKLLIKWNLFKIETKHESLDTTWNACVLKININIYRYDRDAESWCIFFYDHVYDSTLTEWR